MCAHMIARHGVRYCAQLEFPDAVHISMRACVPQISLFERHESFNKSCTAPSHTLTRMRDAGQLL